MGFRDILGQHLAEEQRWYAFRENQMRAQILEWLRDEGIEPTNMLQAAQMNEEELLEFRHQLLDEVLIFVQAACDMAGVSRIALIGSLTTDKVDPIFGAHLSLEAM